MRRTLTTMILLAGLAGAAAPPARPAWVPIGSHVDGGMVEVDKGTIRTIGGLTYGWWRLTLTEPRPDGTAREKHLEAIDCDRGLTTSLDIVSFGMDGTTLNDAREDGDAALRRMRPATPGTTGELAARAICRMRPKT